jgi:hypothetical protein
LVIQAHLGGIVGLVWVLIYTFCALLWWAGWSGLDSTYFGDAHVLNWGFDYSSNYIKISERACISATLANYNWCVAKLLRKFLIEVIGRAD